MPTIPAEIEAAIKAAFEADEERDRQRRRRTGETEIELCPSPEDPHVSDATVQADLNAFGGALRGAGVPYSQRAIAFDAVDVSGYPLAEFTIKTLGPAAVAAITAALTSWLTGRAGRKVQLKFGDTEIAAPTTKDVERVLKMAAEYRASLHDQDKSE